MIDLRDEELIPLKRVPDWCSKHTGYRPHRSTVDRWRLRGSRGAKLETILIGGVRHTSVEKLQSFFNLATAISDGVEAVPHAGRSGNEKAADDYLDAEGL